MIPHAGAMNQQQDMALKPLFTTAELAKSALLERHVPIVMHCLR